MKSIFLALLLFPIVSFAQLGIKAGFTDPRGFHAGVMGMFPMKENPKFSIQSEILVQNKSYTSRMPILPITDYSIQLPVGLRKEFGNGEGRAFAFAGTAPSFGLSERSDKFYWSALLGGGFRVRKFNFEARFDYGFQDNRRFSVNGMVSIGYFFWRSS